MEPGPRALSEPVLERVLASVDATPQQRVWRGLPGLVQILRVARFAAATASVVLVGTLALALAAGGFGRGIVGVPLSSVASAPVSGAPSSSLALRSTPLISGTTLSGIVAATGAIYKVRYPEVGAVADPAAASINTLLRNQADAAIRDFTSGIGKDPQAGPNQQSTLQVDYTVAYSSPDILSLRVNAYSYPSGAAHGTSVLRTFTFDLASGRQLGLSDLFQPGVPYLATVAAEARTQLRGTLAVWNTDQSMADWLTTGSEPTPDNYSGWAIAPGGLEVTFGQYQVAPYAAGMPVVTIPVTHLAGLINPNGPLAALAASPLPTITVSLGIYSGRPDPSWTLTDVQVATIVGQLAALPMTNGTALQGGLGYHGFSILEQQVGVADHTFVAYRGAVTEPSDQPGTYRTDPARRIESTLLETGRSHLTTSQISVVEADLAQP